MEMTSQNSSQPPNRVLYPLGRGKDLRSPSLPCPGSIARAKALPPTPPQPQAPGLGRAKSRTPGTSCYPEPPASSKFNTTMPMPSRTFSNPPPMNP